MVPSLDRNNNTAVESVSNVTRTRNSHLVILLTVPDPLPVLGVCAGLLLRSRD